MSVSRRDALLSRLASLDWPHGALLDALALDPAADVLDVGAGDGRLLTELRRRGQAGVDPRPGGNVLAGRAEALPFPDASFDAALLVRVLAHLQDPAAALAEARRVLRPGGLLLVAAHGPDHLSEVWRMLDHPPPLTADPPPAPTLDLHLPVTLTAADARALARSYGLELTPAGDFPLRGTLHLRVQVWKKGGEQV